MDDQHHLNLQQQQKNSEGNIADEKLVQENCTRKKSNEIHFTKFSMLHLFLFFFQFNQLNLRTTFQFYSHFVSQVSGLC